MSCCFTGTRTDLGSVDNIISVFTTYLTLFEFSTCVFEVIDTEGQSSPLPMSLNIGIFIE